jgi:hypothetical protein
MLLLGPIPTSFAQCSTENGSPYTREHIRRFGQYVLDMADLPPRSIRNHCRSRKPERAHRSSKSDASPDPAVIQLVGAFRAYPQLTS